MPWADFDPFAKPSVYVVRSGDTLGKIADNNTVSVDDLRAWNGIEGDGIEADQVLLIWGAKPKVRSVQTASARPVAPPKVVKIEAATVAVVVAPAPPPPPREDGRRFVSTAGILSMDAGGSDVLSDLTDDVEGLSTREASRGSGLSSGSRSDLGDGTAESGPSVSVSHASLPPKSGMTATAVRAPKLPMPAPKRCLAGPTGDDLGDEGMVTAEGLTAAQIKRALDAFVYHTAKCIPAGSSGGLAVTTEITVGCDGRVSSARVIDSGSAPDAVATCIATTLAYAAFPAHDLPDGMTFTYPINFRF